MNWGLRASIVPVASAVAFLVIQAVLSIRNLNILAHTANAHIPGTTQQSPTHQVGVALALNAAIFVALTVPTIALALRGYRWLWAVPVTLLVAAPILLVPARLPRPIGTEWLPPCVGDCADMRAWLWIGAAVDSLLVLGAGAAIAIRVSATEHIPRGRAGTAACLFSALMAVLVYRTATVLAIAPEFSVFISASVFAFLFGSRTRQWPQVPVVFALAASGVVAQELHALGLREFSRLTTGVMPGPEILVLLVACFATSLADREVLALEQVSIRPLALLVSAIVLNLVDATSSWLSIRAGNALELNPLVKSLGLPVKIVGVTALCLLLYKYRPQALVWPTMALAAVCVYHLSGLLINV